MKKLLLVFVPAVLLLTSCLSSDDNDSYTPPPAELNLYNGFVTIKGFGEIIVDVVNKFIEENEEGNTIDGVSFVEVNNTTTQLKANMTSLYENNYYGDGEMARYFRDSLKATITKLDGDRKSISIDVSKLTKVSDGYFYGAHKYAGSIVVADNVAETTSTVLMQDISFNGFSLDSENHTLDFIYRYQFEGYNTPGTSDDTYTWLAGDFGYGMIDMIRFTVEVEANIVKSGSLTFTSSGTYGFTVLSSDPEVTITPYFKAVYNAGSVTVNGIEYTQGSPS